MREVRQLGGQTLVYGLGGVALQLFGVITVPVYARAFTPAEFGVFEIGIVTGAVLQILVDAGMASASQRSYFDHSDEEETERRRILSTAFLTQLAVASLVAAILIGFADPISELLFDGQEHSDIVMLIGASLPLFIAAQFAREILRLEFRPWGYLAMSLAGAAVATGIGVAAVTAWDKGVEGPFIGLLIGPGVAAGWGLALVGKRLLARPSGDALRVMARFGLPLIPTALALWALSLIDRLMLAGLADLEEVGQYAIANRLSLPVILIVTALAAAYSPFMLSLHQSDPEHEKVVRSRVLTDFTAALCATALVFTLWAEELGELIAPDFDEAYQAVGIVAAGLVAYGASTILVAGISISRQTRWLAIYSAIAAGVNIAINFVLIPPIGQFGAAVATLAAYALLAFLYYRRAQVLYPTPYRMGLVLAVYVLMCLLLPLGAIDYGSWEVALAAKLGAVLAFVAGLFALGILRRGELSDLASALRG